MLRRKVKHPKHASLAPRKPVKRRNVKRAAKTYLRAYGEKADWIREHDCVVPGCQRRGIAAHVGGGGMGYKGSSANLVPLCATGQSDFITQEGHHDESHRIGVKTFQAKYGVDLKALAAQYEAEWQSLVPRDPQE